MLVHDFISLKRENIPLKIDYELFKTADSIQIPDGLIMNNKHFLTGFNTHWNTFDNQSVGLCYHGITIISNQEINNFVFMLNQQKKHINRYHEELERLILFCESAVKKRHYIIHYGI